MHIENLIKAIYDYVSREERHRERERLREGERKREIYDDNSYQLV